MGNLPEGRMIDRIALFLIGLYSLGSALWGSNFSERHLTVPSLGFPVFIGEMLLAACLLLWAVKYWRHGMTLTRWHKAFFVYFVFIVCKALWDFGGWGPLAFRNAALFYYTIFALFGYSFYKKEYFQGKWVYGILAVCMFLTSRFWDCGYFWYTAFILAVVLIMTVRPVKGKLLLSAVLLGLLQYPAIFAGSRTHLMSVLTALLFLTVIFVAYFLKVSPKAKVWIACCALAAVLAGVYVFADRNGVQSCLKLRDMVDMYSQITAKLDEKRKTYHQQSLRVAVYHDNKYKIEHMSGQAGINQEVFKDVHYSGGGVSGYRNFNDAQGNGIFRMLIWHDMFIELKEGGLRSLLGVGLGKPQRSVSLEMLWWGGGEWSRDGWITPHNVYFHFIYRLGAVGLLVIIAMFAIVVYLTRSFIALRSATGVLLVSILAYWMMACNSLVILELPHYAIPFWTLMGLTWAYGNEQLARRKQVK